MLGFVLSGAEATSSIGLSAAPQCPSLCLDWTAEDKCGLWVYWPRQAVLLVAAARGTGGPCLHLESVEGVAVQHQGGRAEWGTQSVGHTVGLDSSG